MQRPALLTQHRPGAAPGRRCYWRVSSDVWRARRACSRASSWGCGRGGAVGMSGPSRVGNEAAGPQEGVGSFADRRGHQRRLRWLRSGLAGCRRVPLRWLRPRTSTA